MKEYHVERHVWRTQPDPVKLQETCDRMVADGWQLVTSTGMTGSGGGSVVTFWEREKQS